MNRAASWLSHDLTALVQAKQHIAAPTRPEQASAFDFDVVIVGSGYGGAVAAAGLVGRGLSVCVLERGREYLAGSFPSRLSDLAGHVRFASRDNPKSQGEQDGLFDLRLSGDASVLVANGLGGGSLINAGVMEPPLPEVLAEARWPAPLKATVTKFLERAARMQTRLGARSFQTTLPKTQALGQLAGKQAFRAVPITVADRAAPNTSNVSLSPCVGCGDCATGCNFNAKDSLDLNLLHTAQRAGAEIYSGATVQRVLPLAAGKGWEIELNHTVALLKRRQKQPFKLRARRVILAAGTLGSTEILMRSQPEPGTWFSRELGEGFSANGDMVAAVHGMGVQVNGVASEEIDPTERCIGPTITAMLDARVAAKGAPSIVVQDLAVPAALQRLYEEAFMLTDVLAVLGVSDDERHETEPQRKDTAAVQKSVFEKSLVVAAIGRDDADGVLAWPTGDAGQRNDGVLGVVWANLKHDPRLAQSQGALEQMLEQSGQPGRVLANPMWRPLTEAMEGVFGAQRGSLLTVHPLGGCCMGDDVTTGVVDHAGRVFDIRVGDEPAPVHDGLYVLDGSIVPTSLGINPALTIATLADRALEEWAAAPGSWVPKRRPATEAATPPEERPRYKPKPGKPPAAVPTRIEITERMRGRILLKGDAEGEPHHIELTLSFNPQDIDKLISPNADDRRLTLEAPRGRLRISRAPPDTLSDEFDDAHLVLDAQVSGGLRLFALEASTPLRRRWRGLRSWFFNRGWRDIWQSILLRQKKQLEFEDTRRVRKSLCTRVKDYVRNMWRLLSHAGAVRLLEYELTIQKPQKIKRGPLRGTQLDGVKLHGVKRFTYGPKSNPWKQLATMSLTNLTGQQHPAELSFDTQHAARIGVPLLRVTDQRDRPAALLDLGRLALYVGRVLAQVHGLSLRKPDPPAKVPIDRLPGTVRGLPPPATCEIEVDAGSQRERAEREGISVQITLTRYRAEGTPKKSAVPPVLLIHGYSASGTTFAHDAIPGHAVGVLCKAGRDVWVLDMRSSPGMEKTAPWDWRFEDMAEHDIPPAVEHICKVTQSPKVDVVAHCMGAAMLSLALLYKNNGDQRTPSQALRSNLHKRMGRVVMSQAAPVMQLSADNTLRAYLMNYVRTFLPLEDYAFRNEPGGEAPVSSQLLDRFLTTLPYPESEFRRENPLWPPGAETPWVGTRHRIDALYARTFSLANMPQAVLDRIDDFFGPLSVETVSQVIHFAQQYSVTDRNGRNYYTAPRRMQEQLTFPVLHLCGHDNGLVDRVSLDRMVQAYKYAALEHLNADKTDRPSRQPLTPTDMLKVIEQSRDKLDAPDATGLLTWCVKDFGHQDCMFGQGSEAIHQVIADFLDRKGAP